VAAIGGISDRVLKLGEGGRIVKKTKGKSKTAGAAEILDRLRRIALALPEASETMTFGHPTFRAGKKTFAVFESYRGEDTICFKATREDQVLLVLDPRFFIAPYVGQHGWTSMRVGAGLDWREATELVEESYRLVATKRMLAALDETGLAEWRKARTPSKKK
jgi:predicted DNA-binding protein (MmcQ/YjbR family)